MGNSPFRDYYAAEARRAPMFVKMVLTDVPAAVMAATATSEMSPTSNAYSIRSCASSLRANDRRRLIRFMTSLRASSTTRIYRVCELRSSPPDDRADGNLQTQPLCHGSQNGRGDRHKQRHVGAFTDIRAGRVPASDTCAAASRRGTFVTRLAIFGSDGRGEMEHVAP